MFIYTNFETRQQTKCQRLLNNSSETQKNGYWKSLRSEKKLFRERGRANNSKLVTFILESTLVSCSSVAIKVFLGLWIQWVCFFSTTTQCFIYVYTYIKRVQYLVSCKAFLVLVAWAKHFGVNHVAIRVSACT